MAYYVYMIRCAGGSLYTGVAADWKKRLRQHAARGSRSARYTRAHPVEALEALWTAPDRVSAQRLEYRLKRLSAAQKRQLVSCPARWREWVPELSELPFQPVAGATLQAALSPAPDPDKEEAPR